MKRFLLIVVFFTSASSLSAERIFTFDAELAIIGALDDNPRVTGLGTSFLQTDDFRSTYAFYPTLSMDAVGPDSEAHFYYGFGLDRVESDLDLDSETHTFGLDYRGQLTRRLRIIVREKFRRAPDFTTQDLFRGIVFSPEGVFFDFDTVSQRRNSTVNTASVSFDYEVGAHSFLTFGLGHSLRDFAENLAFVGRYSNQTRYSGNFRYNRELGSRSQWSVGYNVRQFDFDEFDNARTHVLDGGYSRELGPSLYLDLRGGPSYTESLDANRDFLGFDGSFNLSKSIEDNVIVLSYSRRNGASSGIGSVSRTDRISLNFARPIGRHTSFNIGISAYDTDRLFDNPIDTRGMRGSATLNFLLSDNWALTFGGSYVTQESNDEISDFDRNRLWVSVRFLLPEFWRFRR